LRGWKRSIVEPLAAARHERHGEATPDHVRLAPMMRKSRGRPRKPRYEAMPSRLDDDRAWMLYDARTERLIAMPLNRHAAETLAHTLNVADLSAPVIDYGGDP
jgi:hypothetical protein